MDTANSSAAMIVFRGFPTYPDYVWSPFVTKLEAMLRFYAIPYKLGNGSPLKGPKSKIPYVQLNSNSPLMGDSHLIIRHLVERGAMKALADQEAVMTPAQKAEDLGLRAMLEDRLNYISISERWTENYYKMRDDPRGPMGQFARPLAFVIGWLAYNANVKLLYGQGTSRYTREELDSLTDEILTTLEDLVAANRPTGRGNRVLKHGPFWVLDTSHPTELDATLYAYITVINKSTANPRLKKLLSTKEVLLDYARRIHRQYFPDYPSCLPED